MKYINKNSNRGIVNLFADFIVKKINKTTQYDVVIEVVDCGRFLVVNGMTNCEEILDIMTVKEEFMTEYKTLLTIFGYEHINIIDLIIYKHELVKKDEHFFTLYSNNIRPYYHKDVTDFVQNSTTDYKFHSVNYTHQLEPEIDFSEENVSNLDYYTYNPLNITSEFPYGHSLSMGRSNLYYSEYICNQIFDIIGASEITFKFSLSQNKDEDFNIRIKSNGIYKEETIKSLILDVFDFNISKFQHGILSYDIIEDITIPFGDKPWLIRDRVKDLVVF
jgi:hypothetical protein